MSSATSVHATSSKPSRRPVRLTRRQRAAIALTAVAGLVAGLAAGLLAGGCGGEMFAGDGRAPTHISTSGAPPVK